MIGVDESINVSVPVFKGTKIKVSVSGNFSFQLEIDLVHIDNSVRNVMAINVTAINFVALKNADITVEAGGILSFYLQPIGIQNAEPRFITFNVYTENDLAHIFSPFVVALLPILLISIFIEIRSRNYGVHRWGYYGEVSLFTLVELFIPSLLALVTFTFAVPNFDRDREVIKMILYEMGESKIYSYLYWVLIAFTGSVYLTRRSTKVRTLWTTFRGRERTFVYRMLYASRSLISVLFQTIILYFLNLYVLALGYQPLLSDLVQISTVGFVISASAVTHLSIYGLFDLVLGSVGRDVFVIVQFVIETLSSSLSVFTTYTHSSFKSMYKQMIGASAIVPLVILGSLFIWVGYRLYTNSEVYS